MPELDRQGLLAALSGAGPGGSLANITLAEQGADLSGLDFSGLDCSWMALDGANLARCRFDGARLDNSRLKGCILTGASFKGASLAGVDFRGANLTGADISGANLRAAWMEEAILTDIIQDEDTRYFRLRCPEKGAFIGYKKCYGDRIAMLLIPADARRVSGTTEACRCDRAKVLTITSIDFTERFAWANSYVKEDFIYREGEWVEPDYFTENRWCESTYGIHFWMGRDEAINY